MENKAGDSLELKEQGWGEDRPRLSANPVTCHAAQPRAPQKQKPHGVDEYETDM